MVHWPHEPAGEVADDHGGAERRAPHEGEASGATDPDTIETTGQ